MKPPAKPPGTRAELAVALRWDGEGAPRVTAKGRGEVASEILARARANDVPIRESPEVVEVLARVELGSQIPESLYRAVAEVLAFAWALRGRTLATAAEPAPRHSPTGGA